jgi:3-deoxy-manno-octulosonate cytidylyltransferase (CMP-KDO synthetase)
MKIIGVIPARYGATRFPGKALADICGKPMIQHVYERTIQVSCFDQVIVATDDVRIQQAVTVFGGNARMTSTQHTTGTDRLAEVAQSLDADIVVNIQGDEPLIHPVMIEQAIQPLLDDPDVAIGTLKHVIESPEELLNPNVTKVVTDQSDRAIYFSRSPIPYLKGKNIREEGFHEFTFYRHIGLYAYRREFLLTFTGLAHTPLESVEGLEQLRALEHGYIIKVIETPYESIGVDVPEDVEKIVKLMRET